MEKKKVLLFGNLVNCPYIIDENGNEIFLVER